MLRAFRIFGVWLLIAAFIVLVVDGTRSIASNRLLPMLVGEAWFKFDAAGLSIAQAAVERHVSPVVWDPVITSLLTIPVCVALGVLALLFLWLGRRRRRIDIFVNEP